jgi:hypothetical protein
MRENWILRVLLGRWDDESDWVGSFIRGVKEDINKSSSDNIVPLFSLSDLVHLCSCYVQKMLQEEGLNRCEDATWTSLSLVKAIVYFAVEKEALVP